MIVAKTITFKYNPLEDRIEVILNYNNFESRLDLMMSRKLLLRFLALSENIFIKHGYQTNSVNINSTNEAKNVKKLDVKPTKNLRKHETKVDVASMALAKKQSLLLNKVEFMYIAKNKLLIINFFVGNELIGKTTLSISQFEQIIGALMRVIPFVDWGISPNILDI